jgi:hypothetical protein
MARNWLHEINIIVKEYDFLNLNNVYINSTTSSSIIDSLFTYCPHPLSTAITRNRDKDNVIFHILLNPHVFTIR